MLKYAVKKKLNSFLPGSILDSCVTVIRHSGIGDLVDARILKDDQSLYPISADFELQLST